MTKCNASALFPMIELSVVSFTLLGTPVMAHTLEREAACAVSLEPAREKVWSPIGSERQGETYSVFDFKSQDYNDLLYFMNSHGGVGQLNTFFSRKSPNAMVTVVPLGGRRTEVSSDYLAEFAPKTEHFFDLVINLSNRGAYEALVTSADKINELREISRKDLARSSVSTETTPKKSWLQRVIEKCQSMDQKMFDVTDSHTNEEQKLITNKPLIKELPNLFPPSEEARWAIIFVEKTNENDLVDQLAQIGYTERLRVIDHVHVDRDYKGK